MSASLNNRKRWARVYFVTLEALIVMPLILGVVGERILKGIIQPEGFLFYAAIYSSIVAYFMLLLSSYFLLRIERWLGISAIITVLAILALGLLS